MIRRPVHAGVWVTTRVLHVLKAARPCVRHGTRMPLWYPPGHLQRQQRPCMVPGRTENRGYSRIELVDRDSFLVSATKKRVDSPPPQITFQSEPSIQELRMAPIVTARPALFPVRVSGRELAPNRARCASVGRPYVRFGCARRPRSTVDGGWHVEYRRRGRMDDESGRRAGKNARHGAKARDRE